MRIEVIDFPSDPRGETGTLRKELVNALRKVDNYPSKSKLIHDMLSFATKTLNDIDKDVKKRAAIIKRRNAEADQLIADAKVEAEEAAPPCTFPAPLPE
jgi:hypothetical protein